MSTALGVDIGGTKIQFCTIEADMSVRPLGRTPTALLRRGTTAFASDLAQLIRSVAPHDCARVAVSLNGVLDLGTVVYSSLMGGRVGFPLEQFLAERLDCPVIVDDDIHAMTKAEAKLGAGREAAAFAMLNVGTGIGVGCFSGTVLRGRFAAGLISEQAVYVDELAEYRSLDRTVCGRGIREMYKQIAGEDADAVTVFARARDGEDRARKTVAIFARHLGYVMQLISRFYHPERIVLNGSIRLAAQDYLEAAILSYRAGIEPAFLADVTVSELDHAAELGVLLRDAA
ncbi:putative N-acetylmannosamine kinase [Mesorhizobium plurifarium]|jgi:predicted NBD/HSP70 family sugar kinase|uniref:Putative N-acetylmannosamine kinase n=1 Tax=Mesorhizobium plurifarium TaxID=69974 RepID=A0A0K2VWZ8_MESPL|nr:putative N-acetylmannosamine kinase [Mesorhizobium plurifarium]